MNNNYKMSASVIRYRKLVTTDVASQAVNLAESGTMGHRVQIPMSVDDMNTYFVWDRPAGTDRALMASTNYRALPDATGLI